MQSDLHPLGIDLSIHNYPASVLFAQDGPLYKGTYDLEWSIDTNGPDPDNAPDWNSAFIPPNGANTSWLRDPIVDRTSAAAAATFDQATRKRLYQEEEARIRPLVPAVFFYWETAYYGVSDDVRGFEPGAYIGDTWNAWEWNVQLMFAQSIERARRSNPAIRTGARRRDQLEHVRSRRNAALSRAARGLPRRARGTTTRSGKPADANRSARRAIATASRVDVDVLSAEQPFDGIELAGRRDRLHPCSPLPRRSVRKPSLPYARDAMILDVPARSQYVLEEERGWCSAASLSMVNAYHGIDRPVEETARAVLDRAYNGTGNWAFNTAYSGSLGLRAAVAYLQNLDQAARLIERNHSGRHFVLVARRRASRRTAPALRRAPGRATRFHRERRLCDQRSRCAGRARRLSAQRDRSDLATQ